jgi:Immunoglobulin I-set domain
MDLVTTDLLTFQSPVTIRWFKYDGSFSERTTVDRGTLYIQDAQVDDSGVYICQAQSGSEIVRNNVTLTVGGKSKDRA